MRERQEKTTNTDAIHPLGYRDMVTAGDIGWPAVKKIANNSTSSRASFVKALVKNGEEPQLVIGRKWVRDSHNPNRIIPSMRAMSATARTSAGDTIAATYTVYNDADLGAQAADTLRVGATSNCVDRDESLPIFACYGPWHIKEAVALLRATFHDVGKSKVPSSAVKAIGEWLPTKEVLWMMMSAHDVLKIASELRAVGVQLDDIEHQLELASVRGQKPAASLIARRNELRVALKGYSILFGFHVNLEVEHKQTTIIVR